MGIFIHVEKDDVIFDLDRVTYIRAQEPEAAVAWNTVVRLDNGQFLQLTTSFRDVLSAVRIAKGVNDE